MSNFRKNKAFLRVACLFVAMSFLSSAIMPGFVRAQDLILPSPTQFVNLSTAYSFPVLKGMKFDPSDPLKMQFIIDTADQGKVSQEEASQLIKYFLAGLTIPETDLWVNMSPYEHDNMITTALSETDLGKDLLSQDYILKQLSSSLTYPESDTGKDYWAKTYQEVQRIAHTTKLPVNTFNKIWIMPEKAEIYENETTALITKATLKTLLDRDYLALKNNLSSIQNNKKNMQEDLINKVDEASSKVMREQILPKINQEVNSGKNFATLRQIYHSLILAIWFKQKFKDSIYKQYIDKGKVKGIDLADKDAKDKIYNLYVEAFKKGVYNYIKSDFDQTTHRNIKRQYFSGGFSVGSPVDFMNKHPMNTLPAVNDLLEGNNVGLSIVASPITTKGKSSGSPTTDRIEQIDKAYELINTISTKPLGHVAITKLIEETDVEVLNQAQRLLNQRIKEAQDKGNYSETARLDKVALIIKEVIFIKEIPSKLSKILMGSGQASDDKIKQAQTDALNRIYHIVKEAPTKYGRGFLESKSAGSPATSKEDEVLFRASTMKKIANLDGQMIMIDELLPFTFLPQHLRDKLLSVEKSLRKEKSLLEEQIKQYQSLIVQSPDFLFLELLDYASTHLAFLNGRNTILKGIRDGEFSSIGKKIKAEDIKKEQLTKDHATRLIVQNLDEIDRARRALIRTRINKSENILLDAASLIISAIRNTKIIPAATTLLGVRQPLKEISDIVFRAKTLLTDLSMNNMFENVIIKANETLMSDASKINDSIKPVESIQKVHEPSVKDELIEALVKTKRSQDRVKMASLVLYEPISELKEAGDQSSTREFLEGIVTSLSTVSDALDKTKELLKQHLPDSAGSPIQDFDSTQHALRVLIQISDPSKEEEFDALLKQMDIAGDQTEKKFENFIASVFDKTGDLFKLRPVPIWVVNTILLYTDPKIIFNSEIPIKPTEAATDALTKIYLNLTDLEQTKLLAHIEALATGLKPWEGFSWVPKDYGKPYIFAQRLRSSAYEGKFGVNRVIYESSVAASPISAKELFAKAHILLDTFGVSGKESHVIVDGKRMQIELSTRSALIIAEQKLTKFGSIKTISLEDIQKFKASDEGKVLDPVAFHFIEQAYKELPSASGIPILNPQDISKAMSLYEKFYGGSNWTRMAMEHYLKGNISLSHVARVIGLVSDDLLSFDAAKIPALTVYIALKYGFLEPEEFKNIKSAIEIAETNTPDSFNRAEALIAQNKGIDAARATEILDDVFNQFNRALPLTEKEDQRLQVSLLQGNFPKGIAGSPIFTASKIEVDKTRAINLGKIDNAKYGHRELLLTESELSALTDALTDKDARLAVYQIYDYGSISENLLFTIYFENGLPMVIGPNIWRDQQDTWKYGQSPSKEDILISYDPAHKNLRIETRQETDSKTLRNNYEIRLEQVKASGSPIGEGLTNSLILKQDLKITVTEDAPARSHRHDAFSYLYLDSQDAIKFFESLKDKIITPQYDLTNFKDYFVLFSFTARSGDQKQDRIIPLGVVAHKDIGKEKEGEETVILNFAESAFAQYLLKEWVDTNPLVSGKTSFVEFIHLKDNFVVRMENFSLRGNELQRKAFESPYTGHKSENYPYISGNIEIVVNDKTQAGSPVTHELSIDKPVEFGEGPVLSGIETTTIKLPPYKELIGRIITVYQTSPEGEIAPDASGDFPIVSLVLHSPNDDRMSVERANYQGTLERNGFDFDATYMCYIYDDNHDRLLISSYDGGVLQLKIPHYLNSRKDRQYKVVIELTKEELAAKIKYLTEQETDLENRMNDLAKIINDQSITSEHHITDLKDFVGLYNQLRVFREESKKLKAKSIAASPLTKAEETRIKQLEENMDGYINNMEIVLTNIQENSALIASLSKVRRTEISTKFVVRDKLEDLQERNNKEYVEFKNLLTLFRYDYNEWNDLRIKSNQSEQKGGASLPAVVSSIKVRIDEAKLLSLAGELADNSPKGTLYLKTNGRINFDETNPAMPEISSQASAYWKLFSKFIQSTKEAQEPTPEWMGPIPREIVIPKNSSKDFIIQRLLNEAGVTASSPAGEVSSSPANDRSDPRNRWINDPWREPPSSRYPREPRYGGNLDLPWGYYRSTYGNIVNNWNGHVYTPEQWKEKQKKGSSPLQMTQEAASGSIGEEKGGIDLGSIDVVATPNSVPVKIPAIDLSNLEGFTFQIIRMQPINNLNPMFGIFPKVGENKDNTVKNKELAYLKN